MKTLGLGQVDEFLGQNDENSEMSQHRMPDRMWDRRPLPQREDHGRTLPSDIAVQLNVWIQVQSDESDFSVVACCSGLGSSSQAREDARPGVRESSRLWREAARVPRSSFAGNSARREVSLRSFTREPILRPDGSA